MQYIYIYIYIHLGWQGEVRENVWGKRKRKDKERVSWSGAGI